MLKVFNVLYKVYPHLKVLSRFTQKPDLFTYYFGRIACTSGTLNPTHFFLLAGAIRYSEIKKIHQWVGRLFLSTSVTAFLECGLLKL
jgi:hypothetical protein